MKSPGITRQVDTLGRVVIPKEIRRNMGLEVNASMEIFVDDEKIVLKKDRPGCVFCDEADDLTLYKGKYICKDCLKEMTDLL